MKATLIVSIERPAKKSGGDRYQALAKHATWDDGSKAEIGDFQIYIPQQISRAKGSPAKLITITFEETATEE